MTLTTFRWRPLGDGGQASFSLPRTEFILMRGLPCPFVALDLLIHFCNIVTMIKTKKRINISVSEDINQELIKLAERDEMPVATKALELIREALEFKEDIALSLLAQERDKKGVKYLTHEKFWRQQGL